MKKNFVLTVELSHLVAEFKIIDLSIALTFFLQQLSMRVIILTLDLVFVVILLRLLKSVLIMAEVKRVMCADIQENR
jgi:hypothetical protein